jgi:hypothetical protein
VQPTDSVSFPVSCPVTEQCSWSLGAISVIRKDSANSWCQQPVQITVHQVAHCSTFHIHLTTQQSVSTSRVIARTFAVAIRDQSKWHLWWSKWHSDRFVAEYFGFPLPVPFHQCFYFHSCVIWGLDNCVCYSPQFCKGWSSSNHKTRPPPCDQIFSSASLELPHIMILHSQESVASPYPELHQSSTRPQPISCRSILVFSSHLRLMLPSALFPSGFRTKTLCTSPLCATCPAHLTSEAMIRSG